jgi:DNA mismatch repair protein MutL
MSVRIKILPENLTNKIAAGEVVERPASVVKELVENALDAGCGEVVVEIEAGGRRLIRVSDTGSGMSREDALLALERHATSKIATDTDLFSLMTLGFRGEALPSIASVSRFTLASREEGQVEGTEIYAEGGRIKEVKACGMARGTVVSVRNLFFNTPARLKFMKSAETETGHIGDFMTRLAISRPEVRFTYINDGRTIFRALDGSLQERIAALLGADLAAGLYPVESVGGAASVRGFVGRPECSRSTPSHLYTYINGRFIRDKVVQHAILQSYRNFMERGRYPVVVLFIEVSPDEVDVNVHPTKHEVRFREQGRVHDAIQTAVEAALRATPWLVSTAPRESASSGSGQSDTAGARRIAEVREALARYQTGPERQQSFAGGRNQEFRIQNPEFRIQNPESRTHGEELQIPNSQLETPHSALPTPDVTGFFSRLTLIGQFHAAYILCQDGTDLVIVDQHAAHERVAFERLRKEFAGGRIEAQGLLFPETMECSFGEAAACGEHLPELDRLGFELESFGGSTRILKTVPRILAGGDYLRTLRDILAELGGVGRSRTFGDLLEDILARIACHSVVRGSRPLSTEEIAALFAQMDGTDFSTNCPHGRPVFRRIGLAEIEKMFKRI